MRKHVLDPEALSVETFAPVSGPSLGVFLPLQPATEPADTSYTQCGESCYRSCGGNCPVGTGSV